MTDAWSLYGNYYEGSRAPQVWGFLSTLVNGTLKFESGRSAEIGTRVQGPAGRYGSIAGWRLQFDHFGVFYTGLYENLGRIVSRGVDVVADWEAGEVIEELDGLLLSASFTIQESELKEGPNAGNETSYAWDHKAAWRASYAFDPGWSASVGGVYVGESFSDELNTETPSADGLIGINLAWTVWDAQLARRFDLTEEALVLVAGAPRHYYMSANLVLTW